MALSREESDKIRRWTAAKVKRCPVCGQATTSHADQLFILPLVSSEGALTGTKAVVLKCESCGFLLPFAAAAIGIWETAVNRSRLKGRPAGLDTVERN